MKNDVPSIKHLNFLEIETNATKSQVYLIYTFYVFWFQKEVESSKAKQDAAAERLEKLGDTTSQVKKYYIKLKSEVAKSETEVRSNENNKN